MQNSLNTKVFDYTIINSSTLGRLKHCFEYRISELNYYCGTNNTGKLNMLNGLEPLDLIFDSKAEAFDFLRKSTILTNKAQAVRYKKTMNVGWLVGGYCQTENN